MQCSTKKFKLMCASRTFRVILLLCLVFIATCSYSQENRTRLSHSTVERNIQCTTQTNQIQAENQLSLEEIAVSIDQINTHLRAIEEKREWIYADQQRISEANENNWFEQMKATEKELLSRRNELNAIIKKDEK